MLFTITDGSSARRCPMQGPCSCPWCAKMAKINRNEFMFKFKWIGSSGIGIKETGNIHVDFRWTCESKGVLSANSLPHHCCRQIGARGPRLSLIWAPQSQPVSAAAAGVYRFILTPWLSPHPLYRLQKWSHPLTTPQGFDLTDGGFQCTSRHTLPRQ